MQPMQDKWSPLVSRPFSAWGWPALIAIE